MTSVSTRAEIQHINILPAAITLQAAAKTLYKDGSHRPVGSTFYIPGPGRFCVAIAKAAVSTSDSVTEPSIYRILNSIFFRGRDILSACLTPSSSSSNRPSVTVLLIHRSGKPASTRMTPLLACVLTSAAFSGMLPQYFLLFHFVP